MVSCLGGLNGQREWGCGPWNLHLRGTAGSVSAQCGRGGEVAGDGGRIGGGYDKR